MTPTGTTFAWLPEFARDTRSRWAFEAVGQPCLDGNEFASGNLMMISMPDGTPQRYVARGESRPAHNKAMAAHMATFDVPAVA